MRKTSIVLITLAAACGLQAEKVTYEIDPTHSSVSFAVRHFMNKVNGSFGEFSGTVTIDTADMTKSTAVAEVTVDSIDTNNDDRDSHLHEEDYFHVEKHSVMSFKSTKWVKTGEDEYDVTGDLTILGTTKPVTLEVEVLGTQDGIGRYEGLEIIGIEGEGKIDRSEWGLDFGGPIVGDEVDINISVQGHRKKT